VNGHSLKAVKLSSRVKFVFASFQRMMSFSNLYYLKINNNNAQRNTACRILNDDRREDADAAPLLPSLHVLLSTINT
jgi:hypothetical protein